MTANQKIEYMYAELQSKKKPKAKKKVAAGKSKLSEENAALRECIAQFQSNEGALVEKVYIYINYFVTKVLCSQFLTLNLSHPLFCD